MSQFKPGARVPSGVSPEGVLAERDRIEAEFGACDIDTCTQAVLSFPDKYPNLRAFGPADEAEAFRNGIAQGIRMAFASVVIKREGPKERFVREIQSVQRDGEKPQFRTLDQIKRNRGDAMLLAHKLRADAEAYAQRQADVLAELFDVLSEGAA